MIQTSIPCAHCGASLLGLDDQALCPNCETPVDPSLSDRQVTAADVPWMRTMGIAALGLAVGLFLTAPWMVYEVLNGRPYEGALELLALLGGSNKIGQGLTWACAALFCLRLPIDRRQL